MGKALYRKYRSRSLNEIVGQDHITTTLHNALKAGRISHAYLLTGPRGVGKTSIARILAHEINGLPYSEDPNLDIIEIDAASNRRIDEMRDLRERVATAPASSAYKVYIIDEVHMLTKEAFNALLKTLEEPPAHVVFILATTEAHKLPPTIVSRTQRYSFRPVPQPDVAKHLRAIATTENISITDDALALIAEHGEGSFRDSISLLDQASGIAKNIDVAAVEQLLGRAPQRTILALAEALATADRSTIITTLHELYDTGYEPAMIAVQLGSTLREQLLHDAFTGMMTPASCLALMYDLLAVPAAHNPKQLLEVTLLRHSTTLTTDAPPNQQSSLLQSTPQHNPASAQNPAPQTSLPPAKPAQPAEVAAPKAQAMPADTGRHSTAQQPPKKISPSQAPTVSTDSSAISDSAAATPAQTNKPEIGGHSDQTVKDLWAAVLQDIKKTHNTLYGIARMANPVLQDDTLTLQLKFAFHQKRLNEARNRNIISACVTKHRQGAATQVVCVVSGSSTGTQKGVEPSTSDLQAITAVFGGAEPL